MKKTRLKGIEEPKYKLGDEVFYLNAGTAHKKIVTTVRLKDGDSGVARNAYYRTDCSDAWWFSEEMLHESLDSLLDAIRSKLE